MKNNLDIDITVVTPLQQNCTLLTCNNTKKSVLIDPGGDEDAIKEMISRHHDTTIEAIWLTHGHFDHICSVASLKDFLKVPVIGPHKADEEFISRLEDIAPKYGIEYAKSFVPDEWLEHNCQLRLGNLKVQVLHCPGHSPGSVVYFFKDESMAIVGDVIFKESIGRTDLLYSNYDDLIKSITNNLWPLGNISFICGHGEGSSFSQERLNNHFVADHVLKI